MAPLAALSTALAALLLAQSAPIPANPQAPRFEQLAYKFDHDKELAEFEVIAGSWTVNSGSLWCTSKGERDELRWRRALTAKGAVTLELAGAGRVALALRAGTQETLIRLDRGEGRVAVETDGRPTAERQFEAKATGPVTLHVGWSLDRLAIRVGDDEPFEALRPAATAPLDALALLSFRSQPRFEALAVEREPGAREAIDPKAAGTLTESQRMAVEQATQLLEGDDAEKAFELLGRTLGEPKPEAAKSWPPALLALLERVGNKRPSLVGREPLATLAAAARVDAADGSATLSIPLRPGWSGSALAVRRSDSPIFLAGCTEPLVMVDVYRYDQKLKYWFGSDPKLVYSSGGGGATLGRARADEQRALHPGATVVREFDKAPFELDGEKAYVHELSWPEPAGGGKTQGMREVYCLHRGDTWRITIVAAPLAQQLAADDLDWLIGRFRFNKR